MQYLQALEAKDKTCQKLKQELYESQVLISDLQDVLDEKESQLSRAQDIILQLESVINNSVKSVVGAPVSPRETPKRTKTRSAVVKSRGRPIIQETDDESESEFQDAGEEEEDEDELSSEGDVLSKDSKKRKRGLVMMCDDAKYEYYLEEMRQGARKRKFLIKLSSNLTYLGQPRKRAKRTCKDCLKPQCLSSHGSRFGKLLCPTFLERYPERARELKAGMLQVKMNNKKQV